MSLTALYIKLTARFCAQFSRRFEHEDDDEHEDETLVADFGVSSVERFAAFVINAG
jgi:hypothetical protein